MKRPSKKIKKTVVKRKSCCKPPKVSLKKGFKVRPKNQKIIDGGCDSDSGCYY